jgi:hypothetical protein
MAAVQGRSGDLARPTTTSHGSVATDITDPADEAPAKDRGDLIWGDDIGPFGTQITAGGGDSGQRRSPPDPRQDYAVCVAFRGDSPVEYWSEDDPAEPEPFVLAEINRKLAAFGREAE